jgi:hypothetical protein
LRCEIRRLNCVDLKRKVVISAAKRRAGPSYRAAAPHSSDPLYAVPCSSVVARLDGKPLCVATYLCLGLLYALDTHASVVSSRRQFRPSWSCMPLIGGSTYETQRGDNEVNLTSLDHEIKVSDCLVGDFTCSDTLAGSHLKRAVLSPSAVANDVEHHKTMNYRSLASL